MTRLAYVVSRFPHVTETFIVRELNAVRADLDEEIELFSLFPPVDPTVHPSAARWVAGLHPGGRPAAVIAAVARWLVERPLTTTHAAAALVAAHRRSPRLAARNLAAFGLACAHARSARALGIRHVHAHFATYPAVAAWTISQLTGATFSFTAHAHDIYLDTSFLPRLLADAAFAVPISAYGRDILLREGAAPDRVHVIHCGVDPAAYAFAPRTPPPAGVVRMLCVASLQEYKGHRFLLRALATDDPPLRRIHLELAGRGELRDELESLSRDLGLEHRVSFLGPLTEPEIVAALARAHAFVLPSIVVPGTGFTEGIPVSLMEAMASGTPVIASSVAGVPELVIDGETGLLAVPADEVDLRRALTRLLTEPQTAIAERSLAARRIVERQFDLAASAAQMTRLLSAQLDPRPAVPTGPRQA
ncbi:MAG TPA: glycosyltransferase [Solirubrobacteraceae bacterium]|jgi:glycosyltransferase involved in cell wall biosynthesis|nr:glycosyltransferase [Solirubrobacteraceae bacterium]